MSDMLQAKSSESIDLGSKFLRGTKQAGVLRVVLDRVERKNALTMEMYRGIKRAAVLADMDAEIDALVITGVGEVFCSGGDMGGEPETNDFEREPDPLDWLPHRHLERCSKIVISMINGLCQAGGVDLALCSDISVASERATFRVPELLRGIADTLLSARLPQQVGMARAKYLMFTAAKIDATEAERIGLVAKVVPAQELESHVAWVVEQVRLMGPEARAALKRDVNAQLPAFDLATFLSSVRSPEMHEGVRAFLEKRAPRWPRKA